MLTSILLDAGTVTTAQVEAALVRQRETGLRIGETLVELGSATEEDIGWALARQLDLPFVDLHPDALDQDLVRSFADGMLWRLDAVPLVNDGERLSVAVGDPTDPEMLDDLAAAAGVPLVLAVATPTSIRRVLGSVLGPRHDFGIQPTTTAGAQFDVQWDRSGANFLLFHLTSALRSRATEVHFVPGESGLRVVHRVGPRLVEAGVEPLSALLALLARLEALGGPAIDDRSLHAGGVVACPMGADTIDLEVSLLHQGPGVSVVIALDLPPPGVPSLDRVGLDRLELPRVLEALDAGAGLAIVTGPPSSEISTTLAALFTAAHGDGRHGIAFGPCARRLPADARVSAETDEAASHWKSIAVAHRADLVALDGVLRGDQIGEALAPEASGRMVLVGTDWTDTFAMLAWLAERVDRRAALADRLSFVLQRRAPRAASAVCELLVWTPALRDALRAGADSARLLEIARADGFVPLAERIETLVASGALAPSAARGLA